MKSCVAIVLGAIVMASCDAGNEWDRPWSCFPTRASYNCEALDGLTWAKWKQQNEGKPAIAYRCVTQRSDDEEEPADFICKPVPSRAADLFEDGTIPRFHCFGTHDESDDDTEQFNCSPHWTSPIDARKKIGSGWFLWLALHESGRREAALMAVATRLERLERDDLLRRINEPTPTPEPPIGEKELDAAVRASLAEVEASEAARKAESDDDIQHKVAASEAAWREGRPERFPEPVGR